MFSKNSVTSSVVAASTVPSDSCAFWFIAGFCWYAADGWILYDNQIPVTIYMNHHHISGSVDDRSFSLRYRLIYRVDNGKVGCSSLFYIPNLNVCHRRACGYILSYRINIQILQALCKILVDSCDSFFQWIPAYYSKNSRTSQML